MTHGQLIMASMANNMDKEVCIVCLSHFNKTGDICCSPAEIRRAKVCSWLCGWHLQYNLGIIHGVLLCDILWKFLGSKASTNTRTVLSASRHNEISNSKFVSCVEQNEVKRGESATDILEDTDSVHFQADITYDDSTDINEGPENYTKVAAKHTRKKSVNRSFTKRTVRSCVLAKKRKKDSAEGSGVELIKAVDASSKQSFRVHHKTKPNTHSRTRQAVNERSQEKRLTHISRKKLIETETNVVSKISTSRRLKRQKMSRNTKESTNIVEDFQVGKEAVQFQCDFCSKSFNASRFLQRHLNRFHPKEITVICSVCGDVCKNQKYLAMHMKKQHNLQVLDNEDLLHCDQCPKFFNSRRGLSLHKEFVHSQENPVNCKLCDLTLKNEIYLKRHMKRSHSDSVICDICGAKFKSRLGLSVHLSAHKGVKSYFCEVCGMGFVRKTSLRRHVQQHNDVCYSCDTCSSSYKTFGSLSLHMLQIHQRGSYFDNRLRSVEKLGYVVDKEAVKRHLNHQCVRCGEGLVAGVCSAHPLECALMFKCQQCELTAEHVDDLLAHLRDHSSGRTPESSICVSFHCKVCHKVFPRKLYLNQHMKKHHPGASISSITLSPASMSYCCHVCGKHFKQKQYLYVHMKQHLQPRTFACHVCDRKFTYKCNLKNHLTTHSEDKPFQCDVCFKLFRRKEVLSSHRLVHNPSLSPFKCHVCGKGLSRKQYLKKHYQIMHPEVQELPPLPQPQPPPSPPQLQFVSQ